MIPIGDGAVHDSVSAKRIQIVFIPPTQRDAVAQNEALKQRGVTVNNYCNECYFDGLVLVPVLVANIQKMSRVSKVAAKQAGGRAQVVACIQLLVGGVRIFPTLVIAQSIYHRIGGLGTRGRNLRSQFFEAQAQGERQRLRQNKGGAGLKVRPGTISPSAE